MTFEERLNEIEKKVTVDDFLKKKRLSGEIPFYVFDYPAQEELKIREHILFLAERIERQYPHIRFKHVELFSRMIEHIKARGNLDKSYALESKGGPQALWKALSASVQPEQFVRVLAAKGDIADRDLIFISGIGTIWPWVRAHSLLNNLQSATGNASVVLFYPGKYTGKSFRLFDKLPESDYYRAFQLVP